MNKKTDSFKNIITVLLALMLLGIDAGPASATNPGLLSAKYISDTELKMTFNITLDVDSTVDETKITVTNNSGTAIAVTDNSAVVLGNTLTITTASVGGRTDFKIDAAAQGLDLAANAVKDSATSDGNIEYLNNSVADGQKPTFTAARTALNTIVLTFSETVDAADTATAAWIVAGATISSVTNPASSTTLTITTTGLTSTSSTPAVSYVAASGTVKDVSAAINEVADGATANAADQVKPTVSSATLNYDTGVLNITFSETIDASATVAADFHINDVTGTDVVDLSALPADIDATTLTFTLTEPQRIAALSISGVNGGNGDAVILDIDAGGVTDMASNTNLADDANTVTESSTSAATLATITLNSAVYVSGGAATVSVNDSDMNTLSGSNQTLTVNLTSTTNSTNLTLTLTETDVNTGIFNGTFTFGSTSSETMLEVSDGDTIYVKYTDNDSVLRFTNATFNAVATKLVINSTNYGNLTDMNGDAVTPASMVAGVVTVFKINATDANGVLDTGFNGTMTISVNGSGIPNLTSYTFVASDNGTKSISVTDNVSEPIVINFNSTSVTTNASTTQAVVPNKPYKLLFNSSMPLGTLTNSLQVNISVADAYNNLIDASKLTGDSFPTNATQLGGTDGLGLGIKFNLSLSLPTAGSAEIIPASVVITNANVNTYVAYVNDTADETVVLRATASGFSPTSITTNLSFLRAVSDLLVSTNKTGNTAHANGGANSLGTIIFNAQLRDASGNALPVPGYVITFDSDNTTVLNVAGQTNTTNASGIATITVSTTNFAGTANITAADSTGHIGTVTVTTTAIVNNATSTLVVSSTARAGDNVTVFATLYDHAGTVMPAGAAVSFNITSGDSISTLNSVAKGTIVTADTNSTGVATVTFRATNASGAHSINATVVDEYGDIKRVGTSEQTITISPNDAAVLVVLPASKGFANIKGTNATFNVTVYDAYNNVNTTGEILVNVSTTDTDLGNMTVGSTVVNNYAVITTSSGIGSMLYTINSTTAGSATLTFAVYKNETGQLSGLSTNFTASVPVTTSDAALTVSATSATVTAGTPTSVTFNVTSSGIAKANATVTLSGAATGSGITDSSGLTVISVTAISAGTITATANLSGYSDGITIITANAAEILTPALTISATPTTVTAGTPTSVTFDVKSSGIAVPNAAVTLSGVAIGNGTTNASGLAVINVNATSEGTITATASKSGYTDGTTTITASAATVNGSVTIGIYQNSTGNFFLNNNNNAGAADIVFQFGPAGLTSLAGDYDASSNDTAGVYNVGTGTFYLKNSNRAGVADTTVQYGPGGSDFVALIGDWDSSGNATIGIYQTSTGTFFLKNSNIAGAADITVQYGPGGSGFVPVVGDWDGSGNATIGIYQTNTGTFFLKNTNSAGAADTTVQYGPGGIGFVPVVGDWDGNGTATIGIYQTGTGTFFLKNINSAGAADITVQYGPGGNDFAPVVGDWNGS